MLIPDTEAGDERAKAKHSNQQIESILGSDKQEFLKVSTLKAPLAGIRKRDINNQNQSSLRSTKNKQLKKCFFGAPMP